MCARYETPKELWKPRHHERRIRLRPDAIPVGSTESPAHAGVAPAAHAPRHNRRPDRDRTRRHAARCTRHHGEGPQGADSRIVAAVAGSVGLTADRPRTRSINSELTPTASLTYQG